MDDLIDIELSKLLAVVRENDDKEFTPEHNALVAAFMKDGTGYELIVRIVFRLSVYAQQQ